MGLRGQIDGEDLRTGKAKYSSVTADQTQAAWGGGNLVVSEFLVPAGSKGVGGVPGMDLRGDELHQHRCPAFESYISFPQMLSAEGCGGTEL